MLRCRISCYNWWSGVCRCVCVCVCVRACAWVCLEFRCGCTVATVPSSLVWCCKPLNIWQQQKYVKTFWTWKFFSPRKFCIWFVLLKRLPYFIQYLYSTSHCATAKDIWSFSYNIVKRLCSSKSQYFYRQWLLHWICSKWDQQWKLSEYLQWGRSRRGCIQRTKWLKRTWITESSITVFKHFPRGRLHSISVKHCSILATYPTFLCTGKSFVFEAGFGLGN